MLGVLEFMVKVYPLVIQGVIIRLIIMVVVAMIFVFSGFTLAVESPELVSVSSVTTSEANGSLTVEHDFYIAKHHVTQGEFEN